MKLFVFGNGNISIETFMNKYVLPIENLLKDDPDIQFLVCEFRGTDTLMLEYLKTKSPNVTVLYMYNKPRYKPDAFKTYVDRWTFVGGYSSNLERDLAAIDLCTHFLGYDFNSDENRVSGTKKNIIKCLSLGRKQIY